MNSKSNTGRARLVRELMAKGFSVRKAETAVNAFFGVLTRGLWRGGPVEIPGGTILVKWRKGNKRSELMHHFRNVQTDQWMVKSVRYPGDRKILKFVPDETLDLTPPPVLLTPEEIEGQKLAGELLGVPVDRKMLWKLQKAAEFPQPRPVRSCGDYKRFMPSASGGTWITSSMMWPVIIGCEERPWRAMVTWLFTDSVEPDQADPAPSRARKLVKAGRIGGGQGRFPTFPTVFRNCYLL